MENVKIGDVSIIGKTLSLDDKAPNSVEEHASRMTELAKDLKLYIETEQKAGRMPPVRFQMFFSSHYRPEDLAGLESFLESSDVFFAELAGWDKQTIDSYNAIASRGVSISGAIKNDVLLPKVKDSKKPFYSVDVPKGHWVLKEIDDLMGRYFTTTITVHTKGQAKLEAENQKQMMVKLALLHSYREEYMVRQLKTNLKQALSEHPEIRNKTQLVVLCFAGLDHSSISGFLEAAGLEMKTHLNSDSDYVYNLFQEELHNLKLGIKEELISGEDCIKIMFEVFLAEKLLARLENVSNKSNKKVTKFIRIVLNKFSIMEMIDILEKPKNIVGKIFSQKLDEKGIKIPYSPEKLDQFLDQHKQS